MKFKYALDAIVRAMKDSSPNMAIYGESVRNHIAKNHRDLYDEEIEIR